MTTAHVHEAIEGTTRSARFGVVREIGENGALLRARRLLLRTVPIAKGDHPITREACPT